MGCSVDLGHARDNSFSPMRESVPYPLLIFSLHHWAASLYGVVFPCDYFGTDFEDFLTWLRHLHLCTQFITQPSADASMLYLAGNGGIDFALSWIKVFFIWFWSGILDKFQRSYWGSSCQKFSGTTCYTQELPQGLLKNPWPNQEYFLFLPCLVTHCNISVGGSSRWVIKLMSFE